MNYYPKRAAAFALLVCAALFASVQPARAQEARGSIVGKISDPSGAAIPRATLNVTNKAMGATQNVTSNDVGFYQATFLIPGTYRVEVEVPGFKKYVRDDVDVRVADRIELPITLEVGTADQSITVVGETPLLNTTTASMGTVVDSKRVAELPVPHGNPFFLISLASGVAFNRDQRLDRPFEPTHIAGYSMDGTRANRSDITLDGAVATATAGNGEITASFVPPADIIQEFKVQTATFDASFGQTEGGVTNISIKSGTNDYHGTAYYNKMVPSLFANDFFANARRIPRADFTYDRYGASLGGPIVLPKLYDGRNKTFFMWGFEGIKEDRPRNNGTPTVPTAAMKRGDFSELLNLPNPIRIYNPYTRRETTPGNFVSDPFPGNVIPANMINPIGRAILSYYPDPLQAGVQNNFQRPELTEHADYISNTIRVDHTISQSNRMFGRINWYDRDSTYNDYFDNEATGTLFQFISRAAVIDDVHTLTPTTVLNVRYGYNRFIRAESGPTGSEGFDLTSLGFPAALNNAVSADIRRFPRIDLTGYQGTGFAGESRPNDIHNLIGNVNQSLGSHYFKYGTEFRSYRENSIGRANDRSGRYVFDTYWTRETQAAASGAPGNIGQPVAALLLGLVTPGDSQIALPTFYSEQSTSWGFFFQDDWKISPKLTVNLGLRWEFETPLTERYNRSIKGFDPNVAHPNAAAIRANYANIALAEVPASAFNTNGGFTYPSESDRDLYKAPKKNLMPRFGFAYQLNDKTVVRGGYGWFYGFLGQRRGDVNVNPFARSTLFNATQTGGLTPADTLSTAFSGGILPSVGTSQGSAYGIGENQTFFNQNPQMPYMQRWQLGGQRELGAGFILEASYVGNRGTRIEINRNINAIPNQFLSTELVRNQALINRVNYLNANVTNPFRGQVPTAQQFNTNANISRANLLRPFPLYGDLTTTTNQGYSWYHSGQAQLEKRFSQGYTLQASYTFSKFMQATEYLNAADPMPTETISDFDIPHRFVASGILELPFGPGRAWGSDAPKIVGHLIGGWQLSAIYTFQSGSPINFGNIPFGGNIEDIVSDNPTREQWFNTGAFIRDQGGVSSLLERNVRYFPFRFTGLRTDMTSNWDASLVKNTRFSERFNFQFKAEFLNALNSTVLPAPNTDPRNALFGVIDPANQANYPRRIQLTGKFIF